MTSARSPQPRPASRSEPTGGYDGSRTMPGPTQRACPALLACAALVACGGPRAEPGPSALVVTLDTTRADAVGAHGGPPGITPRLDALAAEGVVFTAARTVTPLTLPAHASMMTGLYPPRHGIRDNEAWSLPEAALTLAERARAAGLETAGFVAAPVLDRAFGIAQGFETWSQPDRAGAASAAPGEVAYRPAEEVVDAALAWYRGRERARRFLCWVHLYDPHLPLAAPERFLRQARGHPYLAEVARADFALGRLLDALEDTGQLARTAVVVLGDHGEGNGDHGEATHGHFVYDSTLRVPFVVRPAPALRALTVPGSRDDRPASVVDLHPTVAALLGLPARGGETGALDGIDLLAPPPPGRGVYFESYHGYLHWGWSQLAGWADRRDKYVHSGSPELFRPREDHGEQHDRIDQAAPELLATLRARLAEVAAAPALPRAEASVDPQLAREIRALGYAEAAAAEAALPGPLEDTGLPSPHTRREELELVGRASDLADAGRREEAAELFRRALSANPRNATARGALARVLMETGRPAEAAEELEALLRTGFETADQHATLAACREALGDDERARVHYRRALELSPDDTELMRALARVLNRSGASAEAAALLDRVQARYRSEHGDGPDGVDEGN